MGGRVLSHFNTFLYIREHLADASAKGGGGGKPPPLKNASFYRMF